MSRNKAKLSARMDSGNIEVKSKFNAEFRRFSINRLRPLVYEEFYTLVERVHRLAKIPFVITYTDPADNDLLPINNNENFARALTTARPLLRLILQNKEEIEMNGYGTIQRKARGGPIGKLLPSAIGGAVVTSDVKLRPQMMISMPEDFRRVSAIIDVDIVPDTQRRVRLMKNGSDKPLGFYIRDGTSIRVTPQGLEKVPGVFISRLVPGGLAEGTGLIAVNDEVLEVNGIEVAGKTLDQVTDMMVANSSNLIITIKPINQHNNVTCGRPQRSAGAGVAQFALHGVTTVHGVTAPVPAVPPVQEVEEDVVEEEDDEDEVQEHVGDVGATAVHGSVTAGSSGLTTAPAGYMMAPAGVTVSPAGYMMAPAGGTAASHGNMTPPSGGTAAPHGNVTPPAGGTAALHGYVTAPAGNVTAPPGYVMAPAGRMAVAPPGYVTAEPCRVVVPGGTEVIYEDVDGANLVSFTGTTNGMDNTTGSVTVNGTNGHLADDPSYSSIETTSQQQLLEQLLHQQQLQQLSDEEEA